MLPLGRPALNGGAHILNGIGELRDEDDVRATGDTGIEGEPPALLPISSTTMHRLWLPAVVWTRSMASVAISMAE